jgi:hypothetical protein
MLGTFLKGATAGQKVEFVASGKANPNNNVNAVVTTPIGIQAGDIIVALLSNDASGTTFTYPSGFSEDFIFNSTGPSHAVAWKLATSSEPGSYTFTGSAGTARFRAIVLVYRGANTTAPLQIGSTNRLTSTTTGTALSINPSTVGMLIAHFHHQGTTPTGDPSTPSGMTLREWAFFATVSTNGAAAFDKYISNTSATGDISTTFLGTSSTTIGIQVLVKAA